MCVGAIALANTPRLRFNRRWIHSSTLSVAQVYRKFLVCVGKGVMILTAQAERFLLRLASDRPICRL